MDYRLLWCFCPCCFTCSYRPQIKRPIMDRFWFVDSMCLQTVCVCKQYVLVDSMCLQTVCVCQYVIFLNLQIKIFKLDLVIFLFLINTRKPSYRFSVKFLVESSDRSMLVQRADFYIYKYYDRSARSICIRTMTRKYKRLPRVLHRWIFYLIRQCTESRCSGLQCLFVHG